MAKINPNVVCLRFTDAEKKILTADWQSGSHAAEKFSKFLKQKLIKATKAKENPMSNRGYHLGRLYALLKFAGATDIGDEANVYDDSCLTPCKTFPLFFRRLHDKNPSEAVVRAITEVMENVDEFPASLTVTEQGSFSIGFYHQKYEMDCKK